ncbi:guanine deaminase, partial [Shewanella frigidimarina]
MSEIKFGVLGQYFHCPVKGDFEYAAQALILVDNNGIIKSVLTEKNVDFDQQISALSNNKQLIELSPTQYL